jgi:hypothetical protein
MARLIPSDYESTQQPNAKHTAEARTLERLRDGLSNRYTIYHGVHWARVQASGSAYGEIDFIIANPYGRLLAIEQKDTQILSAENDLYARYRVSNKNGSTRADSSDKSITTQVNRNLHALRSQYSQRYSGRTLDIDYLFYLPQARLQGKLPSSIDPLRVIDADRDNDLISVIEGLLAEPPKIQGDDYLADLPRIEDFLSQKVEAVPHIGLLGRSAREVTTHLSGGLSTWAARLEMTPWRLRVHGTAGSGKTQLALQALTKAHSLGKSAIYVCFNRPLADAMKALAPDPSAVVTFHELARIAISQVGSSVINFSDPEAFTKLADEFITLSTKFKNTFDTLIIDEGQDFEQAWADSLLQMAKDDAHVLWLEDPEQSLYKRTQVRLPGWVTLSSPVNYRSPHLLVQFINWLGLTGEPVEAGSSVLGFDPIWHVYDDEASPIPATETAICALVDQGYAATNIAVLSFKGLARSEIAGSDGPRKLANLSVKKQLGYDERGNAIWSEGDLLVDSVFRFKGQAADAIVFTEVDFSDIGLQEKRRLFVALTRARLQVALVTSDRAALLLQNYLNT